MSGHLRYSDTKITAWWSPNVNTEDLQEQQLESLDALNERFVEFQNHLIFAMRLIAYIENEDTRQFTYVLNYMVKLEILDDMETWVRLIGLRNTAPHEDSKYEENKSKHFDDLLKKTSYLYETLTRLSNFTAKVYSEKQ